MFNINIQLLQKFALKMTFRLLTFLFYLQLSPMLIPFSFNLGEASLENTCFSIVYPKTFIGGGGDSYFHSVDMDDLGNFIAGGRSSDNTIVTTPRPIVVYTSHLSYYKWAKELPSAYDYVSAIKLNPSGRKAVLSLNKAPLMILLVNTEDGTLLNSFTDSSSDLNEIVNGGLLYSSDEFIYMAIRRADGSMDLAKVKAETSGSVTTRFLRRRNDASSQLFTLIFGRSEDEIFGGGYLHNHQSTNTLHSFAVSISSRGNFNWRFLHDQNVLLGQEFHYVRRLAHTGDWLFACLEHTGFHTAKLQITKIYLDQDPTKPPSNSHSHEYGINNQILKCQAMFAKNDKDVSLLTVNTVFGTNFYARIDFTDSQSPDLFVYFLPQMTGINNAMNQGILTDLDKGFYVGAVTESQNQPKDEPLGGYLMSLETDKSCISLPNVLQSQAQKTLGTVNYVSDPSYAIQTGGDFTLQSATPYYEDLNQKDLGPHCPCGVKYPTPAIALPQYVMYYIVRSGKMAYPIVPFLTPWTCDDDYKFVYSAELEDGSPLPPLIKFPTEDNEFLFEYSPYSDATDQTFNIKLTGELPNGNSNTTNGTIILQRCVSFPNGKDMDPIEYRVATGQLKVKVPEYVRDPDCQADFNYTVTLQNGDPVPNLITFGDDNRTIYIETTDDNTEGLYKLKFTLNVFFQNFIHTEVIYVDLRVIIARFSVTINSAPWFEAPLQDQLVNAGQSIQYKLPNVEDDLGDNVLTRVNLGTALSFVNYNQGTFDIKPGKDIAGRFQINIILADDNEDPKMSKHNFTIIVNPFDEKSQKSSGRLKAEIKSISQSGVLLIQFNQALRIPEDYNSIEKSIFRIYISSEGNRDNSQIRFDWKITKWVAKEIKIKLEFQDPLMAASKDVRFHHQLICSSTIKLTFSFCRVSIFIRPTSTKVLIPTRRQAKNFLLSQTQTVRGIIQQ